MRANSMYRNAVWLIAIFGLPSVCQATVTGKDFQGERLTVVQECISAAKQYRSSTYLTQSEQFATAAVGIVAGSVLGPAFVAANRAKSAIAGVSGISGAVNGLQAAWSQDGLSANGRAVAYRQFGAKVAEKLQLVPVELPSDGSANAAAWKNLMDLEFYCLGQQPLPDLPSTPEADVAAQVQKANDGVVQLQALLLQYQDAQAKGDKKQLEDIRQKVDQQEASLKASQAQLQANIDATNKSVAKAIKDVSNLPPVPAGSDPAGGGGQ